jgi:hypothetical protein
MTNEEIYRTSEVLSDMLAEEIRGGGAPSAEALSARDWINEQRAVGRRVVLNRDALGFLDQGDRVG